MMINKSSQKIFNNSLLYVLGTVLSKASYLLLIPVYTNTLTKAEYGIATTITSFVATFGIVAILSLRVAIMRFYIEYTEEEKKRFIGTVVITVFANSVLLCLFLWILKDLYTDILFKDIDFYPYILIAIVSLSTEGIYLVYQSLLQARQNGLHYSLNSICYLFANAILVIVFLLVFDMKVLGVILANLIVNTLFALYGILDMKRRKYLSFSFDIKMFKKSLKYSLPILPHNLSNDINTYVNRIIISNLLNYTLSGLYSLASQFSSMVNLVQSAINLAFRPWFIEQMKNGADGREQIKYMTQMIMSLFCFISVTVCVFIREIVILIASDDYFEVWSIVPLFVLVQLVSFIYYTHVQTLMYNIRLSKYTFLCSFSGLIVNVIAGILLVKRLGVYAIVISQLLSKSALSALVVFLNKKSENVDFGLSKMMKMLFIAVIITAISVFVSSKTKLEWSFLLGFSIRVGLVFVAFWCYIYKYLNDYKALIKGMFYRRDKRI